MVTLQAGEKATAVMVYTANALARGEVITKENARVSTWLRTEGAPRYIHLHQVQEITFGAGAVKPRTYKEMFLPTADVLAFHIQPPAGDPPDYEADEKNRSMEPISVAVGTFTFRGRVRVSSHTGTGPSLELARIAWMSLYDVEITNPLLPQMAMQVKLLLLNPLRVTFAVE